MALTYDKFIAIVRDHKQFQKCLNNDLNHNGFQYNIGLNKDTITFNPIGSCNQLHKT